MCLKRLLLTLKPFSQCSQIYGRSPVWVRLCMSIDACEGKDFSQIGHRFRLLRIRFRRWFNDASMAVDCSEAGGFDELLLIASCSSVCDSWMCRTQSPGTVNTSWHNSHRRGGNSFESSAVPSCEQYLLI